MSEKDVEQVWPIQGVFLKLGIPPTIGIKAKIAKFWMMLGYPHDLGNLQMRFEDLESKGPF